MKSVAFIVATSLVAFVVLSAVAPFVGANYWEGPRNCVHRLDGQELVCEETHYGGANLCANLSVNPPRPATYYWTTLCTPAPCPAWLCGLEFLP